MVGLQVLLERLDYQVKQGGVERQVSQIVYDSRKITKDCVFICIEGANFDGHAYVKEAVEQGASVLVVSKSIELLGNENVTVIEVEDTRYAMAFMSAAYFGYPAERLKVIGITGTKGKTTTTYLIKKILEEAGFCVGLIGTIEVLIGEKSIPVQNTTPESFLLQKYFKEMEEAGCEIVVMEVSSQGLMLHRTQGFVFEIGIFTNLQPDHIGPSEHISFEHYLQCKRLLFRQCKVGIFNQDDAHVMEMLEGCTCKVETYGMTDEADLHASNLALVTHPGSIGISFETSGSMSLSVESSMPGRFSVYNALTAIAVCKHFDVSMQAIQKSLLTARVKGRIEMIPISNDYTLMIDYAHNAMALESLLTTLKEYKPTRVVCVFGCGGNRARSRRYEMGEVSGRLADFTVITSDNPRFEDPLMIIQDIIEGIQKTQGNYTAIIDRKEAIAYVIEHAKTGDVIVLAGKGNEDYQEIEGVKYPMDERILIQEILEEKSINWKENMRIL